MVADDAISSTDGYAARDVLNHSSAHTNLADQQLKQLDDLVTSSGLDPNAFPETATRKIVDTAHDASTLLAEALRS
jgi:hypothetical protein